MKNQPVWDRDAATHPLHTCQGSRSVGEYSIELRVRCESSQFYSPIHPRLSQGQTPVNLKSKCSCKICNNNPDTLLRQYVSGETPTNPDTILRLLILTWTRLSHQDFDLVLPDKPVRSPRCSHWREGGIVTGPQDHCLPVHLPVESNQPAPSYHAGHTHIQLSFPAELHISEHQFPLPIFCLCLQDYSIINFLLPLCLCIVHWRPTGFLCLFVLFFPISFYLYRVCQHEL